MSGPEPTDSRIGQKDKERIAELERVVKALVSAIQSAENETGEALMPTGVYYGLKFED